MAEDQTGNDVEPPQNAAERSGSSSESRQKAEGRRHDLPVPRVTPRDGRADHRRSDRQIGRAPPERRGTPAEVLKIFAEPSRTRPERRRDPGDGLRSSAGAAAELPRRRGQRAAMARNSHRTEPSRLGTLPRAARPLRNTERLTRNSCGTPRERIGTAGTGRGSPGTSAGCREPSRDPDRPADHRDVDRPAEALKSEIGAVPAHAGRGSGIQSSGAHERRAPRSEAAAARRNAARYRLSVSAASGRQEIPGAGIKKTRPATENGRPAGFFCCLLPHSRQRQEQDKHRAADVQRRVFVYSSNGGAEGNRTPVRRQLGKNFSGRSLLFTFPQPGGNKHPTGISSFMIHGALKALRTHGLHSNHTRARLVDLPGRMGA